MRKISCIKLVIIMLTLFSLSGCFFSHWTEEERQQFKLACEGRETIPDGLISAHFVGFDREEIRLVNVEHIRDGQIIETFVISPDFQKDSAYYHYRIIYGAVITGHTIKPRDMLRFAVGQQVFTLSDFKMVIWPTFTMFSENYDCVLGDVAINGEREEYKRWFIKPGYRDHVEEMFRLSADSDEHRLLEVGQIILYVDTFFAEKADDGWHEWATSVWHGLSILGDYYVTPGTVDDTGLKFAEAEQIKKQYEIKWRSGNISDAVQDMETAGFIALGVLKTRYAMLQEKIKNKSGNELKKDQT